MERSCARAERLLLPAAPKTRCAIPGSERIAKRSSRSIAQDKSSCPDLWTRTLIPYLLTPRLVDFEKRITGATYEQIAEAGGGIRSSVEGVRKAGKQLLVDKVLDALHEMAEQGTTTVEAKSGYGLTVDSEIKSLEAIRAAAAKWPGTVVATLLGSHVVPKEFQGRAQEYVDLVCEQMIPLAARRKLAQFADVFTDRGAFTAQDTEKIFEAAKKHGLGVRAHVCQLSATALQPLLRFEVASFDHMDYVSEPTSVNWQRPIRLRRWCRAQIIFSAWKNFRPPAN